MFFCPESRPFSKEGVCTACELEGCLECSSGRCSRCLGEYLLFGGQCFEYCPEGYVQSSGACVVNSTEQLKRQSRLARVGDLPFVASMVGGCLLLILAGVALTGYRVYLLGVMHSLWGWLEVAVLLRLVLLYLELYDLDWKFMLITASLALIYLLNVYNAAALAMLEDSLFAEWQGRNRLFFVAMLVLSTMSHFKLSRLLFSFLLEAEPFSCRLASTHQLEGLSRVSRLSLLAAGPALVACVVLFIEQEYALTKMVLFSAEAVLLLTAGAVLSLFWGQVRELAFFEEAEEPIPPPAFDEAELAEQMMNRPRSTMGPEDQLEL